MKEFRESLTPKERIIHDLAETMIKSRYSPHRSNAFLAFLKKRDQEKLDQEKLDQEKQAPNSVAKGP